MPVIVVSADAGTREALATAVRRLFPEARVRALPAAAWPAAIDHDGLIVLADLALAEEICRRGVSPRFVVALTGNMGPDTLMKAEALGVFASLRVPAGAAHLRTVLGGLMEQAIRETKV